MSSKTDGGYEMGDGTFQDELNIDLSYGAQVPDGTAVYSNSVEVGSKGLLRLTLTVSEAGSHLDVTIQTSADNATWRTAQGGLNGTGLFTHVTGTGSEKLCFLVDRFVRAKYDNETASTSTSTLTGYAV